MCNQSIFICLSGHNYLKNKKTESEKKMENKIVRQCVQGLIDDSKLIDTLCKQLETERYNLVKVITDLDNNNGGFNHRDAIDDLMDEVRKVQSKIQDAQGCADEAKSQADYAVDEANDAEYKCDTVLDMCRDLIKDIESKEVKEEEVSEEQKEIDNSNQYEATNN